MNKTHHYYSLDFFRGVCGYGVAITHLYAFMINSEIMEYFSLLFVEFFFVLSGFVLYPQLIKTINKKKNLFLFFQRRWMRTLPLFFIVIVLTSILTNNLFSSDFLKYLSFTQKIYPTFLENDYYPVAWSLSIEEYFYILFPLILINLKLNNFIKYTLIIFFSLILLKFFLASYVNSNFYRTGTFLRLDAILLGFLIRYFLDRIIKFKKTVNFSFILLFIFYVLMSDFFISNSELQVSKYLFVLILQLLSGLTLIIFVNYDKFFCGKKIKNISIIVSKQTYSIYLFHIILIYILKYYNLHFALTNLIYIFSLIIISNLVFNYIEKPILKLRPKLL